MTADNLPAERCVRVNRLRATVAEASDALAADGIAARPVAGSSPEVARATPDALLLDGAALESSAAFRDGLVTPQSRGSQLAAAIAAAGAGDAAGGRAADLCAAPGGKTSQLAALLPGWQRAEPSTTSPDRVTALRANLARLGAHEVEVAERDVLDDGRRPRAAGSLRPRAARRSLLRSGHAGLAARPALAAPRRRRGAPGGAAAEPARAPPPRWSRRAVP